MQVATPSIIFFTPWHFHHPAHYWIVPTSYFPLTVPIISLIFFSFLFCMLSYIFLWSSLHYIMFLAVFFHPASYSSLIMIRFFLFFIITFLYTRYPLPFSLPLFPLLLLHFIFYSLYSILLVTIFSFLDQNLFLENLLVVTDDLIRQYRIL